MLPLSPRGHEIRDSGIPQRQLTQAGGSPPVCDVQAVWGLVQPAGQPALAVHEPTPGTMTAIPH